MKENSTIEVKEKNREKKKKEKHKGNKTHHQSLYSPSAIPTYLKCQLVGQWLRCLSFHWSSYTLLFECLVIQLLALCAVV